MATTKAEELTGGGDEAVGQLKEATVKDMVSARRRLVEVPYTASVTDTVNAMVANGVVAVPVAAPPGQWIGAGGSMILEHDKMTGEARKQYIGMVSMFDVLVYVAGEEAESSKLEEKMAAPVSTVIGNCMEGLSLWTFNPNTSVVECMEAFSKGVHRALVPVGSCRVDVTGVELQESSPAYQLLTQMDVLCFLMSNSSEIEGILRKSVAELGAVQDVVFAVPSEMRVAQVVKCMRSGALNAVPIVEASNSSGIVGDLLNGKGKKLVGTFSATDLRGCPVSLLRSWLSLPVLEFTAKIPMNERIGCTAATSTEPSPEPRPLIACHPESPLRYAMSLVLEHHVHRVWVTDAEGRLLGIITLTDILRVIRSAMLSAPAGFSN